MSDCDNARSCCFSCSTMHESAGCPDWEDDEQCAWMNSIGFCNSAACVCYGRECVHESNQQRCEWYRRVKDGT